MQRLLLKLLSVRLSQSLRQLGRRLSVYRKMLLERLYIGRRQLLLRDLLLQLPLLLSLFISLLRPLHRAYIVYYYLLGAYFYLYLLHFHYLLYRTLYFFYSRSLNQPLVIFSNSALLVLKIYIKLNRRLEKCRIASRYCIPLGLVVSNSKLIIVLANQIYIVGVIII